MKVKIPREINIGAYGYSIGYREGMVKHAHSTGQCYTSDATIWIDPDELKQTMDVTVLHEILHCISDVDRIDIGEEDIDRIAQCLVRVLRDDFKIEFDWSEIETATHR